MRGYWEGEEAGGGSRQVGEVGPEIQNYQIHSVKLGLDPLPRQANLSPGLSGKKILDTRMRLVRVLRILSLTPPPHPTHSIIKH